MPAVSSAGPCTQSLKTKSPPWHILSGRAEFDRLWPVVPPGLEVNRARRGTNSPLYKHGMSCNWITHPQKWKRLICGIHSMPCPLVTGASGKSYWQSAPVGTESVHPASWSGGLYSPAQREAFHMATDAGLSPSPARCSSHRCVLVPRDYWTYWIHQVYPLKGFL